MTSDILEARQRVSQLLKDIRAREIDTGEFGEDLDALLLATQPKAKRKTPVKPAWMLVRRNDPETSWEAALSISSDKSARIYRNIMYVLNRAPHTDEELITVLIGFKFTPSGIRSRRNELVETGWVYNTGYKRNTRAGHPAIVWAASESIVR